MNIFNRGKTMKDIKLWIAVLGCSVAVDLEEEDQIIDILKSHLIGCGYSLEEINDFARRNKIKSNKFFSRNEEQHYGALTMNRKTILKGMKKVGRYIDTILKGMDWKTAKKTFDFNYDTLDTYQEGNYKTKQVDCLMKNEIGFVFTIIEKTNIKTKKSKLVRGYSWFYIGYECLDNSDYDF